MMKNGTGRLAVLGLAAVGWLAGTGVAVAGVTLGSPFGDGMVLQREMPVPVWGWAEPGAKIAVAFQGQKKEAVAGKDGKWRVTLDPLKTAKAPAVLAIKGTSGGVELKDVLVGEVWLCSGQSNMAMPLHEVLDGPKHAAAADHPMLRRVYFDPVAAGLAQERAAWAGKGWESCSPGSVLGWSAVAFYFGRELVRKLDVPIGLVVVTTGATPIEYWVPREGLDMTPELAELAAEARKLDDKYRQELAAWAAGGKTGAEPVHPYAGPKDLKRSKLEANPRRALGVFFNGSVAPLAGYAIRGMIFYQGESNRGDTGAQYFNLHKAMLNGWRKVWGQPPAPGSGVPWREFPFYYVQISALDCWRPDWQIPEVWAGQNRVMDLPNTGMAVIHDLCEDIKLIHPKNKEGVGQRLALWALAKQYGFKDLPYAGPMYKSHAVEESRIRVHFNYVFGGLKSRDGKPLDWFYVAGEDRKFVQAQTQIDADSVVVWSEGIRKPVAVRFAWSEAAQPNLVNAAGLPASPFRTDNWEYEKP